MWKRKHISRVRCVWCFTPARGLLWTIVMGFTWKHWIYTAVFTFLWSQQLYGRGGIFCLVHRADANPLIFTALLQQIHLNPFSSNTLKGAIWRKSNVSHTWCSYTHIWRQRLLMKDMACNKKGSILIHLGCKGSRGEGAQGRCRWTRLWIAGPDAKLLTPESIHSLRRWNPHRAVPSF